MLNITDAILLFRLGPSRQFGSEYEVKGVVLLLDVLVCHHPK